MLLVAVEIGCELQLEVDVGQALAVGRRGFDSGAITVERVVRLHG
jgi:hypothetical protein